MVTTKIINTKTPEWEDLVNRVVTAFGIGQLIPHDWLKHAFGMKPLEFNEYQDLISIQKAIQQDQFTFMQLFDRLKKDVLKNHKWYLVNVRGQGYQFIHPKDQTQYAYDQLLSDLNKAFRESQDIMTHVQTQHIDQDQRAKDRALFSKAGTLKQLFNEFKR